MPFGMERKRQEKRGGFWNDSVRALWITCLLWPVANTQKRIVGSTSQFRDAFLDPTVSHILLKQGLTLTSEEWGLIRPSIDRVVTVSPAEGINGEIELDLGDHSDLVFITKSGGLILKNLRLYRLISFAIGGTGVVHIASQVNTIPKTTIRIQGGTMCLTEGICSALSFDARVAALALEALGKNLDNFDCPIADNPEPSLTQSFEDCLMPQNFDSSDTSGLVHLENVIISCTDECRNRGKPTSAFPSVKLSTGDSRQVVAALTNLILESMLLEIKLLDSLSISSNILSSPISIHVDRHGSKLSIDGLLPDNNLAHMIFQTEGVIFSASTGFGVELTNMVLIMNWFGPGLFSKILGVLPTCDEDEYIFKWPLFFPHVFSLQDSSLLVANTSMVYKECPTNLDFDAFIASLLTFKETAGARDYEGLNVAEPEIEIEKIGNIGIFFKKLTLELVPLSLDLSTGTYSYARAPLRVNITNSNVVCESFGRPVLDVPRCVETRDNANSEQSSTPEKDDATSFSGAALNRLEGASLLAFALLLCQMGF